VALVRELDRFGIIHDASHLAEESFYQLLDLSDGPVMASHSNCRTIVPTDRQLSDGMIQGIVRRGGVIGMVFFDKFMMPPAEYGKRRATLADLIRHVKHVCDLAGDAEHVGIGTDFDGGVGREQIPVELTSAADLPRVAEALAGAGFDDRAVAGVMGRNWLRFFRENLAGP
jgi:membrane dipeptidase